MASGGTNPRELQENLSNSEAQLHQVGLSVGVSVSVYDCWLQVEAALTNDPSNAELLKLKQDLTVSPDYATASEYSECLCL